MKQRRRSRRSAAPRLRHIRTLVHQAEQLPNTPEDSSLTASEVQPDGYAPAIGTAYREWYDIAPLGFYTLDRQGRILELNERGAKLLGFTPDWLIGRAFVVFVAKPHVQLFLSTLRQSIRDLQPQVINVDLTPGHSVQPVQVSLATSVTDSQVYHRLAVVDVTDIRRTEELLQESLANWYSLVHNAPDTIMTVEETGRIVFVNKPLWGYSASALVGSNLLDRISESEQSKIRQCLRQAFRFKRSMCEINSINENEDRWYQFSFGAVRYRNPAGTAPAATTTVVIREVSESKRKERTLRFSGERLRDFAARLEDVREEERTRVAREIHDELGQALTVLKLDLSWLLTRPRGRVETRNKLRGLIAQVDETIERVRRIASELRPSVLDNLGLIPAIEWQASEFRKRTGMRVQVLSDCDCLDLPDELSIAVFRVVQEALTNVVRHAKASKVKIGIKRARYALHISVSDNGIGMKRDRESDLKSLGIVGMKERIFRVGGEVKFLSELGNGTRVEIVIPVPHD